MSEERLGNRLLITATIPETIGKFVAPQLPALRSAGFEVHVACAPGDWFGGEPGSEVAKHAIAMKRSPSPIADSWALLEWVRLIREVRPSVMLGSTPKAGMLSMVAGRLCRVPRRIFLHRGARWETEVGTERRLLLGADRVTMRSATEVLAVSGSLADLVLREGLTATRPTVLGRGGSKGVDLSVFTPSRGRAAEGGAAVLGYVGRLARDKGLDELISVFDRVRLSRGEGKLMLAGYLDNDSPVPGDVLARIRKDPDICWIGPTDDVPSFLRNLDVLVFPSQREGLPNVVVEAAACGVPTVGWKVTGVSDAISDGVSGALVPRGDVSAMAASTEWILNQGRGAFRDECVRWASNFDQREMTKMLVEYLLQSQVRKQLDSGSG